MRLIIGWEPLSSQIELEPRLLSVIFSFGEWLVSSLPASSGQIELVEHKSRSGERFFNSIPPNVKLVLGEVFLKKKEFPCLIPINELLYFQVNIDRTWSNDGGRLEPLCERRLTYMKWNDIVRCRFKLFEMALYHTTLSHVASYDTGRGNRPPKFYVTHSTRRSISISRLHVYVCVFADYGHEGDTIICSITS